ncbi:MAG TPA: NADPH:quinone oxidoreductase family protein [Candidatus Acidoferrales bacterium]|nr:NADPH:quinone oxidoreductase family protein [Candidatus Acidoferrales bacterium]
MRAVIVRDFGSIEALELGTLPDPSPGADEVVVSIQATAVNYVDLLVIGGKYQFLPQRPFSPGKLPAGRILEIGSGVTAFRAGDRVLTLAEQGGYAERVCVPASACIALPESMSYVDAASISLAYDTAWFALKDRARLSSGETVLVLGASGSVGWAAVQLAKAFGAVVLGGITNSAYGDAVIAAGADAVVDLSRPALREDLRDQVHAVTAGRGADVVLDMLGGMYFEAALRAVAWRGRLVVIGFASGDIPSVKVNYLLLKNIEVSGLQVSDYRKRMPEMMAACFAEIFSLFASGKLRAPPVRIYPLENFSSALRDIGDRNVRGRLVLTPNATA